MPTSLRPRLRGSHAGAPASARGPVEYVLLALAATVLVALVFLALGRLVDDQMNCDTRADSTSAATSAAAAPRC
jgi:hypothetical protein